MTGEPPTMPDCKMDVTGSPVIRSTECYASFSRVWGWPSSDTFDCAPIEGFVKKYLMRSKVSVDIFARNKRWATYSNDLNPDTAAEYHMDAQEFCEMLQAKGVKADLVIFDPPYSPTQMKECYDSIGIEHADGGSNSRLYARVRRAFAPLVTEGGIVLTFGWNTHGMMTQRDYEIVEIMLVCHGQAHNDTICLAERKRPNLQGALL